MSTEDALRARILELEALIVEEQQARAAWAERAIKAERERDRLREIAGVRRIRSVVDPAPIEDDGEPA
jgi:hypothetical protein